LKDVQAGMVVGVNGVYYRLRNVAWDGTFNTDWTDFITAQLRVMLQGRNI
jgi:hypothetical protein